MTGDGSSREDPEPTSSRSEFLFKKTDLNNKMFVRAVDSNVSSEIIQITVENALICLMQNFERLKERDAWKVPAGILATLLTVMVTTAPTDKFGLSKETWTAIGLVSTFATAVWLSRDLVRLLRGKHVDPQSIVNQLKTITTAAPDGGK